MQPLIALPLFILVQEPGGLVDAGQRRFVTGGVEQGLVVVARNDHVTAACRRTGGAQQQLRTIRHTQQRGCEHLGSFLRAARRSNTSPSSSCAGLTGPSVSAPPGGPDGGTMLSAISAASSSRRTAAWSSFLASRTNPAISLCVMPRCFAPPRPSADAARSARTSNAASTPLAVARSPPAMAPIPAANSTAAVALLSTTLKGSRLVCATSSARPGVSSHWSVAIIWRAFIASRWGFDVAPTSLQHARDFVETPLRPRRASR